MAPLGLEPPLELRRTTHVEMRAEGPGVDLKELGDIGGSDGTERSAPIDLESLRLQRYGVPVSEQKGFADGPPDDVQRLSERPTRPLGGFVPPEKVGELFARNGPPIRGGEVHEEGERLPGAKDRLPIPVVNPAFERRAPEGPEPEGRPLRD